MDSFNNREAVSNNFWNKNVTISQTQGQRQKKNLRPATAEVKRLSSYKHPSKNSNRLSKVAVKSKG